jgi:hypothetical protein
MVTNSEAQSSSSRLTCKIYRARAVWDAPRDYPEFATAAVLNDLTLQEQLGRTIDDLQAREVNVKAVYLPTASWFEGFAPGGAAPAEGARSSCFQIGSGHGSGTQCAGQRFSGFGASDLHRGAEGGTGHSGGGGQLSMK